MNRIGEFAGRWDRFDVSFDGQVAVVPRPRA